MKRQPQFLLRVCRAAGLLWFALTAAAEAQGTDEAVLLRYRFQPGQEFRYRMTLTGDLGMSMGGMAIPPGAAVPPRIPMTLTATYEMVQKVKSVSPEGVATVSVGFDKLDTTMAMMGMNVTSRLGAGGKIETLMNGQPMPMGAGQETVLPNPFMEMTVDPSGKATAVNPDALNSMSHLFGGQNLSGMFGGTMPGVGGLVLPTTPVRPGESWENRWSMRMPVPLPGPGGAAGPGPVLAANYTVLNKLVKVEDGRAVVETAVKVTAPPGAKVAMSGLPGAPPGMAMGFEKMEQTMMGTQRFLVEEGAIDGSDFDATLAMRMAMSLPAAPAAAPAPRAPARAAPKKATRATTRGVKPAPKVSRSNPRTPPKPPAPPAMKMGVEGTMKMTLVRLTAPDAAAAPEATAP